MTRPHLGVTLFLSTFVLCASCAAFAYEIPLQANSIRDAYFLGKDADKSKAFFASYTKSLPVPNAGPSVSEVRLYTPYAQVVEASQKNTLDYSAQDAAQDYSRRGEKIVVYVRIDFTPKYGFLEALASARQAAGKQGSDVPAEDFWRAFQFQLSQSASQSNVFKQTEAQATPFYAASSGPGSGPLGMLAGTVVRLVYDATNVASVPTQFQIVPAVGPTATANFDLSTLR
jgi:hypothetical protein